MSTDPLTCTPDADSAGDRGDEGPHPVELIGVDTEQARPYAIESSAIIRRYIEVRFDLAAPKRSTEEFLAEAQQSPNLAPEYQTLLADFLQCCDLLKFARTLADRNELVQLHDAAIRFVKETAPSREQASPA